MVKDVGIVFVDIAHHIKIIFLVVLLKIGKQVIKFAGVYIENLAFAVDDVFLQIIGD